MTTKLKQRPLVVLMTAKDKVEAKKIAEVLVKERLAACINIIEKISSIYRWKDKITRDSEALCIIKTTKRNFNNLKKKIQSLHSYTVPEIIGTPVVIGSENYLKWLFNETKK